MSRVLVGLAAVGILEAINFGKQAELPAYHLSVSPDGNELLREPFHAGQAVTLRADAGDSLNIELDATGKQIGGVLAIAGSNGRATLPDEKILGLGVRDCDCATSVLGGWECKVFWRIIDVIFAARAGTLKEVGTIEFFGFMLHPSMLAAGPITTLAGFQACSNCGLVCNRLRGRNRPVFGRPGQKIFGGSVALLLAPGVLKLTQTVALNCPDPLAHAAWSVAVHLP
jgi:hypothetical protein